tara:strand:- start:83 stop:625 length:543 start_codon:yes stop_codon:yes gene_type:complete
MKNKTDDIFLSLIKGVSPLKKNHKLKKEIPEFKKNIVKKTKTTKKETKPETKTEIKNTPINFSAKNIVNKKLKKGKVNINKRIDFHGMTLHDAEDLFKYSIKNCYDKNLRCVLFITGKGVLRKNYDNEEKRRLYYGKIRNSFIGWTQHTSINKFILNVEQAGAKHGGDGAFFVYLRKKKD